MGVRVMFEFLIPGVEHAKEADLGAEMLGIISSRTSVSDLQGADIPGKWAEPSSLSTKLEALQELKPAEDSTLIQQLVKQLRAEEAYEQRVASLRDTSSKYNPDAVGFLGSDKDGAGGIGERWRGPERDPWPGRQSIRPEQRRSIERPVERVP